MLFSLTIDIVPYNQGRDQSRVCCSVDLCAKSLTIT